MKILIIRLSSIGDIILTTPVLEAIRSKYSRATIDFLVMDKFQEAIKGNPHISNLLVFKKEKYRGIRGLLGFARKLQLLNYDLVIDLHAKTRSRFICMVLRKRTLRYRKRVWWKAIGVSLRLIRYKADDTIVGNYFRPIHRLGITTGREKLRFDFTQEDARAVAEFDNCIVMAPGATNFTKKWPAEYFGELGRRLDGNIVLIGGPQDFQDLEDIRRRIGSETCRNLAGKLSLKESGALMSRARFIITNDSGPFHMARAGGRLVFVIFGPTDPGMFTFGQHEVLICSAEPCSPCSLHGNRACPKGHFQCMRNLTPEKVLKIINQQLPAYPLSKVTY